MRERVEWIEEPDRLTGTPVAAAWDRLADRAGTPFSRSAWFSCWWGAFGPPTALSVCALWRGEELAAVLPLARRGRRLQSLANLHTPMFQPLARDPAGLRKIVGAALDACSELELFGLDEADAALAQLEHAAAARGRSQLSERQHVSPLVDTSGDLAHYLADRRSSFREIQRRRRKMERENGARFLPLAIPGDLERELERGLQLEDSGWKGQAGTAILSDPATARFYRSIAAAFHGAGDLRLSSLELEGRLVAFDLALVSQGRYWLLKTAYDETRSSLAPGLALRLSVVERCFEAELDAHEFLGGDLEFKRRFSTDERRHVGVRSYRRAPIPAARHKYRRHVRPLLRRVHQSIQGSRVSQGPRR